MDKMQQYKIFTRLFAAFDTVYREKKEKQHKYKSNEAVLRQALANNACKLPPIKGYHGWNSQWGICLHMLS